MAAAAFIFHIRFNSHFEQRYLVFGDDVSQFSHLRHSRELFGFAHRKNVAKNETFRHPASGLISNGKKWGAATS
jgi:hypothetical protein